MSDIVLLVFEGEKTELQIFDNIKEIFKGESSNSIFYAFYKTNLHILWNEMKEDPDLEIVEVLRERSDDNKKTLKGITREKISQVFLFFDSDLHADGIQNDSSLNLQEALEYFNEETEHGKLYLSYPMVEALKDCYKDKEKCFETCIWPVEKGKQYKTIVGDKLDFSDLRPGKFTIDTWYFIIGINYEKASCLVNGKCEMPGYPDAKNITQKIIYEKQLTHFIQKKNAVLVLSAFPFFIVEYFNEETFKKKYDQILLSFKSKTCSFKFIIDAISDKI